MILDWGEWNVMMNNNLFFTRKQQNEWRQRGRLVNEDYNLSTQLSIAGKMFNSNWYNYDITISPQRTL